MNRQSQESACHICGAEDYVWGEVHTYGNTHTRFVANTIGGFKKAFGMGGEKLIARKCLNCGNIQTFSSELRFRNSRKKKDDEYFD